jgi:uncharacterized protein
MVLLSKMGIRLLALFVVSLIYFISPTAQAEPSVNFKQTAIRIGSKKIIVELAESSEQHSRGLMYRKALPKDSGMLFVFQDEQVRSFWMKNTFIDLSIAFFSADLTLIDIQDMTAVNSVMVQSPPSYKSRGPAKFALEMERGWFEKNKIKVGAKLVLNKN